MLLAELAVEAITTAGLPDKLTDVELVTTSNYPAHF
jgi:hypothetical protein